MSDEGHCRHCGRLLAPAAQFCGGCGIPVIAPEVLTPDASHADIPTMAMSTTDLGAPGDPGAPGPEEPWDWEPRRRVLPWIAAVVAVAVIAGGIVIAVSSGNTHTSVNSNPRHDGPIAMPSVVTFGMTQAISQLERAGVDAKQITVQRVPRQDVAPGTVIEQVPSAGMNVDDRVTLTVSRTPDKMPDFLGKGINAALATFSTLDVTLTVDNTMDASVADGTVLEQQPAGGTPFSRTVHLAVARRPIATNLGDLVAVGSAPTQTDAATITGTVYPNSLVWDIAVCPGAPPVTVSYALGGRYRKLVANTGLSSATQDAADRVHVDITVDGALVVTRNLDVKNQLLMDVDLTGHQQMVLTFTPIGGGDPKCATAQAALGRAHLLSIAASG